MCKDSLPRDSCFDVCEQLLVSEHHLLEVAEPEVDLDHLLECLEAPLPLLPVLQVQDPLEAVKGSLCNSAAHLLHRITKIIIMNERRTDFCRDHWVAKALTCT
jgi:hypothetical protein